MPTNNLDPPVETLAALDETSATLKAVGNAMTCGRGASALRVMFGICDAEQKPTQAPQSDAKQSLQRVKPGLSILTPRI
jgi:hypothetical protein